MLEIIYHFISQNVLSPITTLLLPVDYQAQALTVLQTVVKILSILVPVLITVAYFTYFERKVIGFIQGRIGPNRVGFFGFSLWGLGQPCLVCYGTDTFLSSIISSMGCYPI